MGLSVSRAKTRGCKQRKESCEGKRRGRCIYDAFVSCSELQKPNDLVTKTMSLKPGLYRHYKGNDYQVFNLVTHSETGEQLVVYRCLYGDFSWWVRPLTMFTETIMVDGVQLPRFQFLRAMTAVELAEFPSLPWADA